jgi:hypothetical protein
MPKWKSHRLPGRSAAHYGVATVELALIEELGLDVVVKARSCCESLANDWQSVAGRDRAKCARESRLRRPAAWAAARVLTMSMAVVKSTECPFRHPLDIAREL